jgi:transcriptional regulator with XRE-family HTH domain
MGSPQDLEPFADRVRRLAKAKGWSLERVANEAWDPEVPGTSANLLRKVMRGERQLKPVLVEAVAGALSVPPEEFPEYRLAVARELLDERERGLESALETLSQIEVALRGAPARRMATRAARTAGSPGRTGEAPREDRPLREAE